MQEGWVNVVSRHTTTAVTLNECESRLMDDVRQFLLKLAPPSYPYLHNDIHLRPATEDVRACVRACRPAMRLLLGIDWVACVFFPFLVPDIGGLLVVVIEIHKPTRFYSNPPG